MERQAGAGPQGRLVSLCLLGLTEDLSESGPACLGAGGTGKGGASPAEVWGGKVRSQGRATHSSQGRGRLLRDVTLSWLRRRRGRWTAGDVEERLLAEDTACAEAGGGSAWAWAAVSHAGGQGRPRRTRAGATGDED